MSFEQGKNSISSDAFVEGLLPFKAKTGVRPQWARQFRANLLKPIKLGLWPAMICSGFALFRRIGTSLSLAVGEYKGGTPPERPRPTA